MLNCSLWGGRELGQQVHVHMFWLFSQDFMKGSRARGRQRCRNLAWLHLAWAGVFSSISPTPRLGRACTRASFLPTWSRGIGGVQLADFTWCMGAWPPPHPSIGSRTRATICQYNFNYHLIFKSKCQIKISNADRQVGLFRIIYMEFQNVFFLKHLLLKFIQASSS